MVDTVTLTLSPGHADIRNRLWPHGMKRRFGTLQAFDDDCLYKWTRSPEFASLSITASVGTVLNGNNIEVLTPDQVQLGLLKMLNCLTTNFDLPGDLTLDDLTIRRIDFFAHVNVSKPELTVSEIAQFLPHSERDHTVTYRSGTTSVLRKQGSVVEFYYWKYSQSLEGYCPPSLRKEIASDVHLRNFIRIEKRCNRRSFRRDALRNLNVASDIEAFLRDGYEPFMSDATRFVRQRATALDSNELLIQLVERHGGKLGSELWGRALLLKKLGFTQVQQLTGRSKRTISGWIKKIDEASEGFSL